MELVYKSIDRLATVRPFNGVVPRDLTGLYDICAADGAVCGRVVKDILGCKNGKAGIFTGAAETTHYPYGESDGPPGGAVLARTLIALGYGVTIYTEEGCIRGVEGMCGVLGIKAPVEKLELEPGCAQHAAIAEKLDIAVTIEKHGVNSKGKLHSITGYTRDGMRAKMDGIINAMNDAGKITVGIGDGGNEIGFGSVYEEAVRVLPGSMECKCGCGGGVINVTKVKHLYPVSISNWGAYAISAAFAVECQNPALLIEPDDEIALLTRAAELELIDGGTGLFRPAVDGVAAESSAAYVRLLREIVLNSQVSIDRKF